jgi:hypothetical protein
VGGFDFAVDEAGEAVNAILAGWLAVPSPG